MYPTSLKNLGTPKCVGLPSAAGIAGGSYATAFDHTLYTGADPESLGGGDVILNEVEY